jgi:predicted MPP superfamily phosphohydrolase
MTQPRKKQLPIIDRRSFLKRSSWAAIGFFTTCAIPFYSYFAEPRWLETVELELSFQRLPSAFHGMRILQFSDIHYGFFFEAANLFKLISTINALDVDLIVFTGDLFDGEVIPYAQQCAEALAKLTATPLGLYAVMGNHDYYSGYNQASQVIKVYEQGGFKVLRNEWIRIQYNGQTIQIAGVDDMLLGRPSLKHTFLKADPNTFTILLAHEPEFADQTEMYSVDLQLSGHSHGGQVRFPLIGEVITPTGGKKYVQGLHSLDNQAGKRFIYTNRGIGTSHIPIRFLCRPELTVFTLRRAD